MEGKYIKTDSGFADYYKALVELFGLPASKGEPSVKHTDDNVVVENNADGCNISLTFTKKKK